MPPPTSAYSVENFECTPDEELVCSVCRCVFNDPVECPCRHVFCRSCIKSWLERKKNCPVCRKNVLWSDLHPVVPIITNMIAKLKLNCPNVELGCHDKISLEGYDSHLKVCQYELVACKYSKCKEKFIRAAIGHHEKKECKFRLVRCRQECKLRLSLHKFKHHNCVEELKKLLNSRKRENEKLKKENSDLQEQCKNLEHELNKLKSRANRSPSFSVYNADSFSDISDITTYFSDVSSPISISSLRIETLSNPMGDDRSWEASPLASSSLIDEDSDDRVVEFDGSEEENAEDDDDDDSEGYSTNSRNIQSLLAALRSATSSTTWDGRENNFSTGDRRPVYTDSHLTVSRTEIHEDHSQGAMAREMLSSRNVNTIQQPVSDADTNIAVETDNHNAGSHSDTVVRNSQAGPSTSNRTNRNNDENKTDVATTESEGEGGASHWQESSSSSDSVDSPWPQKRKRSKLMVPDSSETDESPSVKARESRQQSQQQRRSAGTRHNASNRPSNSDEQNADRTTRPNFNSVRAIDISKSTDVTVQMESASTQTVVAGLMSRPGPHNRNIRSLRGSGNRRNDFSGQNEQNSSPNYQRRFRFRPLLTSERNTTQRHGDSTSEIPANERYTSAENIGNTATVRRQRNRQILENNTDDRSASVDCLTQPFVIPILPRTIELLNRYGAESDPDWEPGVDALSESEQSEACPSLSEHSLSLSGNEEDSEEAESLILESPSRSESSILWESESSYEVEIPVRTWDLLERYSEEPSDEDQEWEPSAVI